MAEAHAKMNLRDFVHVEDINIAIRMMLESFLQSQKSSIAAELRPKFAKYLTKHEDDFSMLSHILKKMVKEKARYKKMQEGIDPNERIIVEIT